jgi:benzoate 4-monooxygenase
MLKDAWYDGGAGEYRHMADVRVKSDHQAKRKALAHVFAQKTIANLEPVMVDTVSILVAQLDKYIEAGKPINMRRYMNFFTVDLFAELLYGRSLECLQRGDDVVDAETPEGKMYKAPFIQSLLDATVINTVLGALVFLLVYRYDTDHLEGMEAGLLPFTRRLLAWHPYKKAGADYENIVYHNTKARLRDPAAGDDIFSKLLKDSKGADLNLEAGDILAECSVLMNAGTETTTAAFTNSLYLIYKHPQVLAKVREEIEAVCGTEEVASYETLSQLPYLRACIEESLRVRPPSSFGLPREVPAGGRMIAGQWVDGGVTVSVPTYSLLRDEEAFEQPEQFMPERWLTDNKEKRDRMMKSHLPFSVGPRACIGRNIAYYEQFLVISTLVRWFDFDMPADFELQTIERFNSNPGDMIVHCKRRAI